MDMSLVPQGWHCPVCGSVYGPNTSMCIVCGNQKYTVSVGTTASPVNYLPESQSAQPADTTHHICDADFGTALHWLKHGKKMRRRGWNGKGMWLQMQRPDAHSKMTHPYIYIEYPAGSIAYPQGSRVPWLPSQTDMLGDDWEDFYD